MSPAGPAGLWAMLGQQQNRGDPIEVVVWVGALILVVVGAGLAVMHIRGRLLRKQDGAGVGGSWLDELRSMHQRGEVSDEEFQRARASLLATLTGESIPKRAGAQGPRPGAGAAGAGGSAERPEVRTALPGYDLTGAPLPRPIGERPDGPVGDPG